MDVSCCPEILTMHMTHVGESGYVFYIPNEFAVEIYDSIMVSFINVLSARERL